MDTGRRTPLLIVICLAQFMVILDVSIVNVALPSIHDGLGFSETGLQWVVNAYTITFAGFLMLGGRASDLLGRRRVFLAGIALFGADALKKVKVEAKILAHERGPKLRVFKFKPKRGYKKRNGHRQELTRIQVTKISNGK